MPFALYSPFQIEGLAVRRVVWCLLVLAMPSMALGLESALGLERRDGAYYCTEEKGDTNTLAAIKANENFVVRLTPEPNSQDSSNYRVTITIEGRGSNDCYVNHKLDDDAVLGCDVVGHTYIFNFNTHRFIEIYGANENSPHVARGLCTKISQ